MAGTGGPESALNLLEYEPSALRGKTFRRTLLPDPSGRVEFWDKPKHGHLYVIGADFAYGIAGRDYDAAVILDKTEHARTGIAPQVGELHGHWGESFHAILYATIRHWNGAFLLGERQVGLFTLRTLFDRYQVRWLYYEKDLEAAASVEGSAMKLGYNATGNDLAMAKLREAVRTKVLDLKSITLVEQMARVQWRGSTTEARTMEREPDERLKMKLSGGGSPDLVKACAYANLALECVHLFEQPLPKLAPNSLGAIAGLDELLPEIYGNKAASPHWR